MNKLATLLAALIITGTAFAQAPTQPLTYEQLQAAAVALQTQRDEALNKEIQLQIQIAGLQKQLSEAQAKVAELSKPATPTQPAPVAPKK
jgi:hypothetical protein